MKRILCVLIAVAFLATPAFAGNTPEIDAVGCDMANYFVQADDIKRSVVDNQRNYLSDFPERYELEIVPGLPDPVYKLVYDPFEYFDDTAGQEAWDPCFPEYESILTDPWNEATYTWQIVLQMKPESDINLNIVDCVLKHNCFNVWECAEQTGRYRADWGQLFFVPTASPAVTATAVPGPNATPGFAVPFVMDARVVPGILQIVPLLNNLYTSKALFEEGIVMVLPATGGVNALGATTYNLKQGDAINVVVTIPGNNTVDLRYGEDNVMLKYIGIVGTDELGDSCNAQTAG